MTGADHRGHGEAALDRPLDGLDRRAAGGDDVLDDHHRAAAIEPRRRLEPLAGAVALGLLAHDEGVQRARRLVAGDRDRGGDRIGAQRQATDGAGGRRQVVDDPAEQPPDPEAALGVEADRLAVDVEVGALPRREDDLALGEGVGAQERQELVPPLREGRLGEHAITIEHGPTLARIPAERVGAGRLTGPEPGVE